MPGRCRIRRFVRLSAGAEWIRTFSSALDRQQFVVSFESGPIYGRTVIRAVAGLGEPIEVSGSGPGRRHSPPGSGGVTPRSRCRRCKRIAEPKVRIRSLQRRVRGSHRPGRCRSRTVAFARLCTARAAPSAEERLALVQPGIVVLGQVRVCDSQWARMLILCARAESTGSAKQAADAGPFTWAGRSRSASNTSR